MADKVRSRLVHFSISQENYDRFMRFTAKYGNVRTAGSSAFIDILDLAEKQQRIDKQMYRFGRVGVPGDRDGED